MYQKLFSEIFKQISSVFDFDGTGLLNVNEVYKLTKFHLWEYWKKIGNVASNVSVPTKTLSEAGYIVSKELGKGTQAVVKFCVDRQGTERCVKCYSKSKIHVGGVEEILEEFEAMKLLGCKRIAQTFEIFQDSQTLYMVNELLTGGDFTSLTTNARQRGVNINDHWYRRIFKQCLRALEFMHGQAMVHCDIKEPNLMVKTQNYAEPEVCVVDFGIAHAMGAEDTGAFGGTPGYIPPETLEMRKWFPNGDIFSLGVVIFQVTANMGPSMGKGHGVFQEGCRTMQEIFHKTRTFEPPWNRMQPSYPELIRITQQMLDKNMKTRPRAPKVIAEPWFTATSSGVGHGMKAAGYSNVHDQHPALLTNARPSEPLESKHPLATFGILPTASPAFLVERPMRLPAAHDSLPE